MNATASITRELRRLAGLSIRAERDGDHDAMVRAETDLEQTSVLLERVRDERDDDENMDRA